MTENVKVNIDVSTGSIGIECPETAFETILKRVEEFIPRFASLRPAQQEETPPQRPSRKRSPAEADEAAEIGTGGKRAGKHRPLPVYKMVDLGVEDDAKRAFKKLFESKKPRNQNDQVLLCAFWLNKTLGHDTFTDDDVYTALRAAGALKIPPRIENVISNLKLENKLVGKRGKYKITHIGEDFVNSELPPKAVKA